MDPSGREHLALAGQVGYQVEELPEGVRCHSDDLIWFVNYWIACSRFRIGIIEADNWCRLALIRKTIR